MMLLLLFVCGAACKKDRNTEKDPETKPNETGEVNINGKTYTTVKIGNRVWTSANYAGQSGMEYSGNPLKPEYGRYYSFSEMQEIRLPSGWRIPTEADFRNLTTTLGIVFQGDTVSKPELIKKLSSKTNWLYVQGNNESGFNAFPGGYSVNNQTPIDGGSSEFWMADGKTFCIMERADRKSYRIIFYSFSNQPNDRFNLRLVKDSY